MDNDDYGADDSDADEDDADDDHVGDGAVAADDDDKHGVYDGGVYCCYI